MNKVILKGRLVRDPEVRYSENGENKTAIARYSLAVNRDFKNKDGNYDADFPNCICFGRQAEFTEKFMKKGTEILVEGRLQTGSYTNKDGNKVYTTDIVVEKQEFCGTKATNGGDNSGNQQKSASKKEDDFMSIPDGTDELPFA